MYVHYYMISVILPITTMQSLRISYKILMHVHTFVGTLVTNEVHIARIYKENWPPI